jgi:tetratricopeptide (TPR) repeat protein
MLAPGVAIAAGDTPVASPVPRPPWQRLLQGEDAKKAAELEKRLDALQEAGKFEEALKVARDLERRRRRVQGTDHWEAVNARWQAEAMRRVLRVPEAVQRDYAAALRLQRQANALWAKGQYRQTQPLLEDVLHVRRQALDEEHPIVAASYNNLATILHYLGRYSEAEEYFHKALNIWRKLLGEEHPDTAASYGNLAITLEAQGHYQDAEEGNRKALAIRRNVLGEGHPDTARSYNNLAGNLIAQGRYKDAEESSRTALAILRKQLGEEHRYAAFAYNNLALSLNEQGRYQEAAEGFRKALAIDRKVLGEDHPDTAIAYNNVAGNLNAQGRYKEAEEGYRKALAIRRKVLGEHHSDTALSYNSLASNLDHQGRHKEAEGEHGKALAICLKALGEHHPETALSYNNLAANLNDQGRHKEAEAGYGKALAIYRRALGEEHPHTGTSYLNVAVNLSHLGRHQEAEEAFRKALAIRRNALGEDHTGTATTYYWLAANLHARGRYDDAEASWVHAADSFATARLRLAPSGLGRATKTSERSPLPSLAAVLARNGKPEAAWQRFEEGLGRGTWDDLSARLRRPVAEQDRQARLVATLDRLDQLLQNCLTVKNPIPQQQRQHQELLTRQRQAQEELDVFARSLQERYGPAGAQVFDRRRIQAALPADAALLGWIDIPPAGPRVADPNGEHWGFLLRHAGPPACTRLRGSGAGGAWTDDDTNLPARLRDALQSPRGDWKPLADRLHRQRLGPLAAQLAAHDGLPAAQRLIVLPSPALAGVPAEVLADGCTVSYALSGTLYTHLRQQPAPATGGLFALADPIFEIPAVAQKEAPLPAGGALLTVVVPGGNAAQAGLRSNDVLLRYAGKEVKGPADLKTLLQAQGPDPPIAVTAWRDGKRFDEHVRPGKLGVVLADEPAPRALAELRRLDQLLAVRGDVWKPLPGTRAEVEALVKLFGEGPTTRLLLGSEASQQQLYELAQAGELGRYRYVHLATHGMVDNAWPLRSAVILSCDHLPDPLRQLQAGLPVFEGRLTARQVLEQWHLNSDMVTLSACQTALGKYERGEGFVGFAQALILAGSRSVCLSLWKVDDTATALLMHRFYANLLGRRDGLKGCMSKAAALAEAKAWLQGLSREEALRVAATVSQGLERGKGRVRLPLLPELPAAAAAAKEEKPYAHPYYWAAFVLIGDPG